MTSFGLRRNHNCAGTRISP